MDSYDPSRTPDRRAWLALDEGERITIVREYHQLHGDYGESLDAHTGIHCAVETQIAMFTPNVEKTMRRLQKQGLSRHDAIHAVGSVLLKHMHELTMSEQKPAGNPNSKYSESLSRFNADDWYRET